MARKKPKPKPKRKRRVSPRDARRDKPQLTWHGLPVTSAEVEPKHVLGDTDQLRDLLINIRKAQEVAVVAADEVRAVMLSPERYEQFAAVLAYTNRLMRVMASVMDTIPQDALRRIAEDPELAAEEDQPSLGALLTWMSVLHTHALDDDAVVERIWLPLIKLPEPAYDWKALDDALARLPVTVTHGEDGEPLPDLFGLPLAFEPYAEDDEELIVAD